MSLADRLSTTRDTRCIVARVVDEITAANKADGDALRAAVDDAEHFSGHLIVNALKAEGGPRFGATSMKTHRLGICSCRAGG